MNYSDNRLLLEQWMEEVAERPPPDSGSQREVAYMLIRASHTYVHLLSTLVDDRFQVLVSPTAVDDICATATEENLKIVMLLRHIKQAKADPFSPWYRGDTSAAETVLGLLAHGYTILQGAHHVESMLPLIVTEDELWKRLHHSGCYDWMQRIALLQEAEEPRTDTRYHRLRTAQWQPTPIS